MTMAISLMLLTSISSAASVEDVSSRDVHIRLLIGIPPSPVAVVVLFAGGHGALDIHSDGQIAWGGGNFLVRSRKLFQEQGSITVVIDAPTDKLASGMHRFRDTEDHAKDIAAVIRYLRTTFDHPIWLVGTSRGTESVANAAIRLEADLPDGIVLTSSMLKWNNKGPNLLSMKLDKITIPTLIVHHKSDDCKVTPYDKVESLRKGLTSSPKVDVLEYQGGQPEGGVCNAYHYHGYRGIEEDVVKDISQWIKTYSPPTGSNNAPRPTPHPEVHRGRRE
jgi:dienelactone hydrolase